MRPRSICNPVSSPIKPVIVVDTTGGGVALELELLLPLLLLDEPLELPDDCEPLELVPLVLDVPLVEVVELEPDVPELPVLPELLDGSVVSVFNVVLAANFIMPLESNGSYRTEARVSSAILARMARAN